MLNNNFQYNPKRYIIFILFVAASFTPAKAQYKLEPEKDIIVGSASLGVFAAGNILEFLYERPLTLEEIEALDRDEINSFDRNTTYKWNPDRSFDSDVLIIALAASPALLMLHDNAKEDWLTIGVMYAESMALLAGLNSLTKITAGRARPFAYNENAPLSAKLEPDARKSFYSAHTSFAFNSAIFVSTVASNYIDNGGWKAAVWSLSLTAAAGVGYLRYESGKHFPSDILTGAVVGSLTGFFIPYIHRSDDEDDLKKETGLNFTPVIGPRYTLFSFSYNF